MIAADPTSEKMWRRQLVASIDDRLVSMIRRPALYGPPVAVELQVVQLLSVRAATVGDGPPDLRAFRVGDLLVDFHRRHFPASPPTTLADVLETHGQTHRFAELLGDFCRWAIWLMDRRLDPTSHDSARTLPLDDLPAHAHGRAAITD